MMEKTHVWGRVVRPLPKRNEHVRKCLCSECKPGFAHDALCRCITRAHAANDTVRV